VVTAFLSPHPALQKTAATEQQSAAWTASLECLFMDVITELNGILFSILSGLASPVGEGRIWCKKWILPVFGLSRQGFSRPGGFLFDLDGFGCWQTYEIFGSVRTFEAKWEFPVGVHQDG
jgi:hypothetical protein